MVPSASNTYTHLGVVPSLAAKSGGSKLPRPIPGFYRSGSAMMKVDVVTKLFATRLDGVVNGGSRRGGDSLKVSGDFRTADGRSY